MRQKPQLCYLCLQGEVISWKYADPMRARTNLENLVAGA